MRERFKRAWGIFRNDGVVTLLGCVARFSWLQIRTVRRQIEETLYAARKPDRKEFTVDGTIATFDTAPLSKTGYDYSDDLVSESEIIERFISDISSDDVVYDVGANVGLYSCFAANRVPPPELIVAFEPHPGNADQLRKNARLNPGEIRVEELALSNETGTAVLDHQPPTGHVIKSTGDGIEIQMKTGRHFVREADVPAPTMLKIDVEGAETSVLEGFQSILETDSLWCVYCEVHPTKASYKNSEERVRTYLEAAGFDTEILSENPEQVHLRATKDQEPPDSS